MALQCLAIIGKINEPLYLKDIQNPNASADDNDENDVFGFAAAHTKERLSLRKEVSVNWNLKSLSVLQDAHSFPFCI